MSDIARRMLTPPQAAKELAVSPTKVLGWIRRGELAAIDLSTRRGGRPRYRISRDALDAFLGGRAVITAPPVITRRPRRTPDHVIEFF